MSNQSFHKKTHVILCFQGKRTEGKGIIQDGDLILFSRQLESALSFGDTNDLNQITVAEVSMRKIAKDEDIIKVAQTLKIAINKDEPLGTLRTESRILEKLKDLGFDGAIGTDSAPTTKSTKSTKSPNNRIQSVVAFDIEQVRVVDGIERKVALTRAAHLPSPADLGKNWTPAHSNMAPGSISAAEFKEKLQKTPGFDVNAINASGFSTLMMSAALCSLEHLQALDEMGADFSFRNIQLASVAHACKSSESLLWLKKKGVDLEAVDDSGNTPLHINAGYNRKDLMQILITQCVGPRKVDFVNATNMYGETPLYRCASHSNGYEKERNLESIQCLLDAGADPNMRNNKGRAPLHVAQHWAIPYLLKAGANPNICDDWGITPAHLAASHGNEDVLNLVTLNALGASMRGIISQKEKIEKILHEPRLFSAARSGNATVMQMHLALFPSPSNEDLEKTKKFLKTNKSTDVSAILQSHLAAIAVDEMLAETVVSRCAMKY